MLRLAILVVLALSSAAHALVVIDEPPIVEACPRGRTWKDVDVCLTRQGAVTIERVLPKAKLIRLVQTEDKRSIDLGLYLYIERDDGSWSIGGMFSGTSYSVIDFAPQTIDNHAGFRLSVGQLVRMQTSLDGGTQVPVILMTQRTLFCSGENYRCADTTTHCDVLYRGKTVWTFRGTLAFEKGLVRDVGDRSKGGRVCMPTERVFLGWPQK